ncbi:hypothetical protein ABPG75_011807 [Micractinium tetrahymenae]
MSHIQEDEIKYIEAGGTPEIQEMMRQRFGPAVQGGSPARPFVQAWLALPADQFAASCAAFMEEAAAAHRRCKAAHPALPDDLLELVTKGPVFASQPGERPPLTLFRPAQRRRIWAALPAELAALERHLGGSSYAWAEFQFGGLMKNLLSNFWSDAGRSELGPELELEGNADAGMVKALALLGRVEREAKRRAAGQPPQRILRFYNRHSAGGGCSCCGAAAASGDGGDEAAQVPAAAPQAAQAAGSSAAATTPPQQGPEGDPSGWRVGQLKAFLAARGVDCSHCIEKSQLVDLACVQLQGRKAKTAAGAAEAHAAAAAAGSNEGSEAAAGGSAEGASNGGAARCAGCGATQAVGGGKLRRCSGCEVARFCSAECQAKAWPQHRKQCKKASR